MQNAIETHQDALTAASVQAQIAEDRCGTLAIDNQGLRDRIRSLSLEVESLDDPEGHRTRVGSTQLHIELSLLPESLDHCLYHMILWPHVFWLSASLFVHALFGPSS